MGCHSRKHWAVSGCSSAKACSILNISSKELTSGFHWNIPCNLLKWIDRSRQGKVMLVEEERGTKRKLWERSGSIHAELWAWMTWGIQSLANEVKCPLTAFLCAQCFPVLGIDTAPVQPVDHVAERVAGCDIHCQQSNISLSLYLHSHVSYSLNSFLPFSIVTLLLSRISLHLFSHFFCVFL